MTKPIPVPGGPLNVGRHHVFAAIRRNTILIKATAGSCLWILAAALVILDCTDDRLGILTGVAGIALTSGLALITLAVIDWQVTRMRRTMFTLVELIRREEPSPTHMRLIKS